MYARAVGDQQLTFFVSGKLWSRSLVMQDKETESLWSHILGEAMEGPLKGERLESLPCVMTDWETWLAAHPETTVVMLGRTSGTFTRNMYTRPEEFGLGLVAAGKARFWRLDLLEQQPLVNDTWQGEKLLIVYDTASRSTLAFRRQVDGRVLTFARDGDALTDEPTQSRWDWRSGRAISGQLEGTQLEPVAAIMTFSHAWLAFHPDTSKWAPSDTE